MKRCVPLATLASLLLSLAAQAEAKKLTLLVMGDNQGEVTQCGCTKIPTGGLARRKVAVDQIRAEGPTLLLDAGNALFKQEPGNESLAKAKAELILEAMGEMQTAAMAVGMRDLDAGPDFLKSTAKKAKVKLLSVNFTHKGKKVFAPSTVVTVEGVRLGLIGVGPEIPGFQNHPGYVGTAPIPAVLAEAKKLKDKDKVDAIVVLAALPLAEALQLSKEAGDRVNFIFQSGDSRAPTVPRGEHSNFLITTGRRGQMLARLDLNLSGEGPLVDIGQLDRDKQALILLEQRMADTRKRLAALEEPTARKGLEESLKGFEERKAQLQASIASLQQRTGRSLSLSTLILGPEVADDPELKAQAEKLQPPGSVKGEPGSEH